MSGSSSVLSSLGAAFHGLPYSLIFHGRSSSSTIHPALHGHPLMDSFENHLCEEIRRLQVSGQYLTAGWLGQALEAVLSGHSQMAEILPHIQQAVLSQNSKWINDHLDDNVKLLDVCNALRQTMSHIRDYMGTLQLVLHCLTSPSFGTGQLLRARTALERFKGPKETEKFRLENCGSTLWRIGEKLVPPQSGAANPKGKTEFLEAIHASKAFTIFVCGVMVAALSSKSRRSVATPPCAGSSGWGSALQSLHQKVKDEMDKRGSKSRSGRPLLQEVEAVETTARGLHELVSRLINTKSVPFSERQGQELRRSVQCLKKCVADMEQGMAPFERHINELYRVLVTSRMALLDILSYS